MENNCHKILLWEYEESDFDNFSNVSAATRDYEITVKKNQSSFVVILILGLKTWLFIFSELFGKRNVQNIKIGKDLWQIQKMNIYN